MHGMPLSRLQRRLLATSTITSPRTSSSVLPDGARAVRIGSCATGTMRRRIRRALRGGIAIILRSRRSSMLKASEAKRQTDAGRQRLADEAEEARRKEALREKKQVAWEVSRVPEHLTEIEQAITKA